MTPKSFLAIFCVQFIELKKTISFYFYTWSLNVLLFFWVYKLSCLMYTRPSVLVKYLQSIHARDCRLDADIVVQP